MQVNSTLVMFETCRCTLGVGGADDVLWSSVVSLRWQKEYREVLFSCFYEITKHEECICVQVCMHIQCAYVCNLCVHNSKLFYTAPKHSNARQSSTHLVFTAIVSIMFITEDSIITNHYCPMHHRMLQGSSSRRRGRWDERNGVRWLGNYVNVQCKCQFV